MSIRRGHLLYALRKSRQVVARCDREIAEKVAERNHYSEIIRKCLVNLANPSSLPKGYLAKEIAKQSEVKKSVCSKFLDTLTCVATAELKKRCVFTVPGLFSIKIRTKPPTKAGKRTVLGKTNKVKATPARKIVKAYIARRFKDDIWPALNVRSRLSMMEH